MMAFKVSTVHHGTRNPCFFFHHLLRTQTFSKSTRKITSSHVLFTHPVTLSPWQLQQYCHTSGIGLLQEQRLKDHHKTSQVNTQSTESWPSWSFLTVVKESIMQYHQCLCCLLIFHGHLSQQTVYDRLKRASIDHLGGVASVSALLMVSWHPRGTNGSVNCIQLFGKETSWSFFISALKYDAGDSALNDLPRHQRRTMAQ